MSRNESPSKRARTEKAEKPGKGLRHFSMKVCKKVKEKGVTSYNEVADELVMEQQAQDDNSGDEETGVPHGPKNIRRRVYDALNVLMAMNIISKEKKEIKWIGLPSNSQQEYEHLQLLKEKKTKRIKLKTQYLQDLILQQIAFRNLLQRNENLEAARSREQQEQSQATQASSSTTSSSSSANANSSGRSTHANNTSSDTSAAAQDEQSRKKIHLPFIVVNSHKSTDINCKMAGDKTEYHFDFSQPFEIHDDMEVLKRMGLAYHLEKGVCSAKELEKAKSMIPAALVPYVTKSIITTKEH